MIFQEMMYICEWWQLPNLYEGQAQRHSLHPIAKVCKAWNALVIPLMYRELRFEKHDSTALVRFLLHEQSRGQSLHTRAVVIHEELGTEMERIIPALWARLPNLRSLTARKYLLTSVELRDISSHCKDTLEKLDSGILDYYFFDVCFAHIAELHNLRHLFLRLPQEQQWSGASRGREPVRGLFLPRLEFFGIDCQLGRNWTSPISLIYAHILAKCRFPVLNHLRLDTFQEECLPALHDFLAQNSGGDTITSLDLKFSKVTANFVACFRNLRNLKVVNMELDSSKESRADLQAADLVQRALVGAGSSLQILVLEFTWYHEEHIVDRILHFESLGNLQVIKLNRNTDFQWYGHLMGRKREDWVERARLLALRGVRLLDMHGDQCL